MSAEPTSTNESRTSRRSSASSARSVRSDLSHGHSRTTPRTQGQPRVPPGLRQSSVSMFTGMSSMGPTSPTRTEDNDSTLSPGSIDRVFPIRSAVSIDPTATPMPRGETGDTFPGMSIGPESSIAARRQRTQSQTRRESRSPVSGQRVSSSDLAQSGGLSHTSDSRPPDSATNFDADRRSSESRSTGATMTPGNNQTIQNLMADSASVKSEGTRTSSVEGGMFSGSRPQSIRRNSQETGLVTARFKHVVTDGGHAVITGRDGETLQRCEDEPIHIPGAVQSFGLLLAFREEDGNLVVRVASENSQRIIGYTPAQLFQLTSFLEIFTDEQADNLLDHLDFIRDDTVADVVANGPEVFMISVKPPGHRTRKMWCAMHINDADRELVVCEFELEDDQLNPLVPLGEGTPEPPEDTLGSKPTAEELADSTVNMSKPLRILRSARKKRGEAAAMEIFNIMSQVQEQLANAPNLQVFLRVLIGVMKELSGFHRVMIYQFDHAWHGRVVAELIDPRATKDLYKGLNFPASDIPKQARELYKVNKVRLLYDRDQETARLVCRTMEDLEKPLDMSHAYLRAMSPIHIKYLGNMAVRSSMSISINAFNELWGLVACHSYGSKGMRVSFPIRKMCRLVGDTACRNIERLSYASRLQARKLINTSSTDKNPSGYIVASSEDLLRLFDSDSGALSIRNETKVMGKTQGHLQEILAVVEYLRLRKISSVYTSQDIVTDFPDLRFAPGLKYLAGILYVPLSGAGEDFIVFFRKGVLQEVKWAGNPYEKFVKEGTEGYLEPRKSFKTWSETIIGRCRDWTEEEVETASVLCLVYGKFIDVWRQKEAALQNSQLTRLLLANSAHEVRTPLNAIINYLEIALESALDQETRDNLTKSHSASKSLVYVINDLLDLTKAEGGQDLVKEELFNLDVTLKEATDPFSGDARRKNIEYAVTICNDFPKVIGDHRRVRQVVSNLVANAIQHTVTGKVTVDAWTAAEEPDDCRIDVEIAVEDTGAGMSQSKVDALFRELEEVSIEGDEGMAARLLDQDPFVDKPESMDKTALGLGLAVVARTIRTMNGQLRLKTEEGRGSRFVICLGFDTKGTPSVHPQKSLEGHTSPHLLRSDSNGRATTPGGTEGEVMLVNRSATKGSGTTQRSALSRRASRESLTSLQSNKSQTSLASAKSTSSQKSDVERLIDAIQEPLRPTSELLRSNSKESSALRPASAHAYQDDLSPTRHKSKSIGSTRDLHPKSAMAKVPGEQKVTDSSTPIRPVRIAEEGMEKPQRGRNRVVFEDQGTVVQSPPPMERDKPMSADHLSLLVAEDDPINSRIVKKRLEKLGHTVYLTVNGEECSSAHGEQASSFDAVLMDLQMPIVDGFTSTKMVRSFEKTQSRSCLSRRAALNGRIPIFAVSASLIERDREKYVDTGFDGWILKPIDFKRVDLILRGIVDDGCRNETVYQAGQGNWEKGGWFQKREDRQELDFFNINTRPSGASPVRGDASSAKSFGSSGDVFVDAVAEQEAGAGGGYIIGALADKDTTEADASGSSGVRKADTI